MTGRGIAQGREPAAASPAGGTVASDGRGHEGIVDVLQNARLPWWVVVEGFPGGQINTEMVLRSKVMRHDGRVALIAASKNGLGRW